MKLLMPVAKISKIFAWTGQVSKPFLRFIGAVVLATCTAHLRCGPPDVKGLLVSTQGGLIAPRVLQ